MLIGVHLGLDWNWIMDIFKKVFRVPEKKVITYISRVMVVLVFAFGVYSTYLVGFLSKISFMNTESRGNRIEGRNSVLGVISMFAVSTYYIEKLISLRKKKY